MTKLCFVQAADPAGFPPTLHAVRCALEAGFEVSLIASRTARRDIVLPAEIEALTVRIDEPQVRWQRALFPSRFALGARWILSRIRPDFVYLSDFRGAALADLWPASKLIYHEHDMPLADTRRLPNLWALAARDRALSRAALVVTPNRRRLELALAGRKRAGAALQVANAPARVEVLGTPRAPFETPLRLHYHGSLGPDRLPLSIIDALARCRHPVELRYAGFEVVGAPGYAARFLDAARRAGLGQRVAFLGTFPDRGGLLQALRGSHVGLVTLDRTDRNHASMLGASNKVFDFLSQGLAVLGDSDPDWNELPELGPSLYRCTDPLDPAVLAATLDELAARLPALHQSGELGRQRCLESYNYEAQFVPVLEFMRAAA